MEVLKPKTLILPGAALVIAMVMIGAQRRTISTIEKESALLRDHIAAASSLTSASESPAAKTAAAAREEKAKESIDWKEFATQMAEMQQGRGIGDMRSMMRFQQRLQAMSAEEMVTALDEITALDLPAESKMMLEGLLIHPLMEKDPELALTRFIGRLQEENGSMAWQLSGAMKRWGAKDPARAEAWLDQQIAAGTFDTRTLDGKSQSRIRFEGSMIAALLSTDPDAAARRLEAMPQDQHDEIMRTTTSDFIKEEEQATYADFIRKHLPDEQQPKNISNIANHIAMRGGYPEVTAFLDRIEATPAERAASAAEAAESKIRMQSFNKPVTREDLDSMREWVETQAPGTADSVTGKALGNAAQGGRQMKFADAAALAVQYHEASGNDDVLATFLESNAIYQNQEESRALAQKLTDGERKSAILKKLK